MPYAANGIVSQSPIEDGIEITDAQYREAVHGMMDGLVVSIAGGFRLIPPPAPVAEPIAEEPPAEELTAEEQVEAYTASIQLFMDNTARSFGYDNIKSAVTYADEPIVPKFQDEGRAFRAWRSVCWAYCYDLLAAIEAGTAQPPASEAELLAALPSFEVVYRTEGGQ
jgi:hypothetical protein